MVKRNKRSGFWKKAPQAIDVAQKALKTAMAIRTLVNVESKYIDIAPFSFNVTNSGLNGIYTLNAIAQGTTSVTRIGDSIKNQSLSMKATIKQHASATNTTVRVWLVKHKEPRGATVGLAADFWENSNVLTFLQTQKRDRYVVLMDRTYKLSANGASEVAIDFSKKLNGHTIYDGNAGTIADIQKDAYHLIALSDEATNTPTLEACLRLRFTDD